MHSLAIFLKIVLIRLAHLVYLIVLDELTDRGFQHRSELKLAFVSYHKVLFLSYLMDVFHDLDKLAVLLTAIVAGDWYTIA